MHPGPVNISLHSRSVDRRQGVAEKLLFWATIMNMAEVDKYVFSENIYFLFPPPPKDFVLRGALPLFSTLFSPEFKAVSLYYYETYRWPGCNLYAATILVMKWSYGL